MRCRLKCKTLTVCLVEWMAPTRSERTFFSSVWMENGGGWSRSEMEYSQHMRVGPVRQNLADEFDPRGFRPSRDGRRLLPRVRHRRGGRNGRAQFRAEPTPRDFRRQGSILIPLPGSPSQPLLPVEHWTKKIPFFSFLQL